VAIKLPLDVTDDSMLKSGVNYFPNDSDNFFVGNSFPTCGINFSAQEIMKQNQGNQ
jgi:ribose transport system substrate-binding protein